CQGDRTKMPTATPTCSGPVNRKPALVWAGAALFALLGMGLLLTGRREGQRAESVAHVDRGADLYRRGMVDEAIAAYREAIRIRPDRAEAHNNLGLALHARGRAEDAVAEFRAAIRLRPDYAEAHFNLGTVLNAQRKREDAIAEFRAAIRVKSDFAEAHMN